MCVCVCVYIYVYSCSTCTTPEIFLTEAIGATLLARLFVYLQAPAIRLLISDNYLLQVFFFLPNFLNFPPANYDKNNAGIVNPQVSKDTLRRCC